MLDVLQIAALTLCQLLAAEANCAALMMIDPTAPGTSSTHLYPPTPLASEAHTPVSETSLPISVRHRKHPSPLVLQLMEMGFARKQVEYAVRMLGEQNLRQMFLTHHKTINNFISNCNST